MQILSTLTGRVRRVHAFSMQHLHTAARRVSTLLSRARCFACTPLTAGMVAIVNPLPIASVIKPTMMASGRGRTSGSPGFLYSPRTGRPVQASSAVASTKLRTEGVRMQQTSLIA
jgi:hypothetical protein